MIEEGNKNLEETTFSFDKLTNILFEVEKDMDNFMIEELLQGLEEISKLTSILGEYMNIVNIDIQKKISRITLSMRDYHKETKQLQSLIDTELSLGLTELNGFNNSSKGFNKDSKFHKYSSISRNVLRIIRILDFINQIIRNILLSEDDIYNCILNSYEKTVGKYHTPLKRSISFMIFSLIPKKKSYLVRILLDRDEWDEDSKEKLGLLSKLIESIWRYLYNYFDARNLLTLP